MVCTLVQAMQVRTIKTTPTTHSDALLHTICFWSVTYFMAWSKVVPYVFDTKYKGNNIRSSCSWAAPHEGRSNSTVSTEEPVSGMHSSRVASYAFGVLCPREDFLNKYWPEIRRTHSWRYKLLTVCFIVAVVICRSSARGRAGTWVTIKCCFVLTWRAPCCWLLLIADWSSHLVFFLSIFAHFYFPAWLEYTKKKSAVARVAAFSANWKFLEGFLKVRPCSVVLALYSNLSYLRLPHRAVWCRPGRRRFSSPICWRWWGMEGFLERR